jgi:hypothetical protein
MWNWIRNGKSGKKTGKVVDKPELGRELCYISKSRFPHLWKHMVGANGIWCPESSFPVRHPVFFKPV